MKAIRDKVKDLNIIALPLIIQSVSGLIIGLTDQAMVGRISVYAYGAVGVVVSMLSMLAGVIGSMAVVFNIRGSNAQGRGDREDFNDVFTATIIMNIIIGGIFLLFVLALKRPLLMIVFGFTDEILSEAVKYISILSGYMLVQLLLFTFGSYFKIHKRTKWILIGSLTASILNLIFDYILIFGHFGFPALGVTGAAISSMISIIVNLLIYIFVCRKHIKIMVDKMSVYKCKMLVYLKDSLPLMGQEILDGSIFVIVVNSIVSRIGANELSAYLILVQLISLLQMPMYMYGSAALTLISQNNTEETKESISSYPRLGIIISMMFYVVIAVIFIALRNIVPRIITDELQVIELASSLLLFMVIAHLLTPVSTIYRYSLQAVGQSRIVLIETAKVNLCILIMMLLLTYVFNIRIYGIFICLFINYLLIAVIFKIKYKKILLNS